MTEGTKSVLFGCHNPFMHGYCVLKAWRHIYHSWPKPWQLVCILLHDFGHIGLNYLSDVREKRVHWVLGAVLARFFVGDRGFYFVAGHTAGSGYELSELRKADKYSWILAPMWWLYISYWVEKFVTHPKVWKQIVHTFVEETDGTGSLHDVYLKFKEKNEGRLTDEQTKT